MSTTRCATVITRVLVRSRFAPAFLTALNILLDTSHLVTALLVALAEVVVAIGSQPGLDGPGYRATNAASSARHAGLHVEAQPGRRVGVCCSSHAASDRSSTINARSRPCRHW